MKALSKMHDIPLYLTVDHKRYQLQGRHPQKDNAQKEAARMRKIGLMARVTRHAAGVWLVYTKGADAGPGEK